MPRAFRPKMFIGSSSEAKPVAEAASAILNEDVIPQIWDMSPFFRPMQGTFEALVAAAGAYDFALFIMSPDDRIQSRGIKFASTRDNVLFELGLFIGAIGAKRVFAVVQHASLTSKSVKLPSDLLGVTIPSFDLNELNSSLRIALSSIKDAVRAQGVRQQVVNLRSGWSYDHDNREFSLTLDPVKLDTHRELLRDFKLVLVARRDSEKPLEKDTAIAFSNPWEMSPYHVRESRVSVSTDGLGDLSAEDIVVGYLILVPKELDARQYPNIEKMIAAGCRLTADAVGKKVGSEQKVG